MASTLRSISRFVAAGRGNPDGQSFGLALKRSVCPPEETSS